jgi:hypothetical protein
MYAPWLFLATSSVLFLACPVVDQSLGAARDKVLWNKTANYSALAHTAKKPLRPPAKEASRRSRIKSPPPADPPAPRILATFDYGDTALWTGSADQSFLMSKPQPTRCEWAGSIVKGYAFDHVEPQTCEGSVLRFEAMRGGQKFRIDVSALNGDLINVEKIKARRDHPAE